MISIWDLTEYRVIDAACLLAHKDPDTVDQSKYPLPASIEAKLGVIEKRFGAIWQRGPVFAVASRDGTVTSNSRSGRSTITRVELEELFSPQPVWFPHAELDTPTSASSATNENGGGGIYAYHANEFCDAGLYKWAAKNPSIPVEDATRLVVGLNPYHRDEQVQFNAPHLSDHCVQIDAIRKALRYRGIEPKTRKSFADWLVIFDENEIEVPTAMREAGKNLVSPVTEKSLKTNERNTLLTIIAALCDYSNIKHQDRGAAGQIAGLTVDIGAVVTDETIKKVLDKIPDALATRKK